MKKFEVIHDDMVSLKTQEYDLPVEPRPQGYLTPVEHTMQGYATTANVQGYLVPAECGVAVDSHFTMTNVSTCPDAATKPPET